MVVGFLVAKCCGDIAAMAGIDYSNGPASNSGEVKAFNHGLLILAPDWTHQVE